MIRISKLTDYALVIMAQICNTPLDLVQAADIADKTQISRPTAAKVLKILAKNGFLESTRGATGGYKLRGSPDTISVANIIQAIEGPLAIMQCALGTQDCSIYNSCTISTPWSKINQVIVTALDTIKLRDLLPGG